MSRQVGISGYLGTTKEGDSRAGSHRTRKIWSPNSCMWELAGIVAVEKTSIQKSADSWEPGCNASQGEWKHSFPNSRWSLELQDTFNYSYHALKDSLQTLARSIPSWTKRLSPQSLLHWNSRQNSEMQNSLISCRLSNIQDSQRGRHKLRGLTMALVFYSVIRNPNISLYSPLGSWVWVEVKHWLPILKKSCAISKSVSPLLYTISRVNGRNSYQCI